MIETRRAGIKRGMPRLALVAENWRTRDQFDSGCAVLRILKDFWYIRKSTDMLFPLPRLLRCRIQPGLSTKLVFKTRLVYWI
jgi:hypothetical protein